MSGDGPEIWVRHVASWRADDWPDTFPPREAWLVECDEHGPLGNGWGYAKERDAATVRTKHERKYHRE